MNYSQVATELFKAIEEYIAESSKRQYVFTIEEQRELERQIKILENQLNILVAYELKRDK